MDKKPKVDPGWNDPPMLNYSPANPPPKSRITNKRVAFPIATSGSTSVSSPIGLPPAVNTAPPVSSLGPISQPAVLTEIAKSSNTATDIAPANLGTIPNIPVLSNEETLEEIKKGLGKYLSDEEMSSIVKSWQINEYSYQLQTDIYQLSQKSSH